MELLQKYYETKLAIDMLSTELEEMKAGVILELQGNGGKAQVPGMKFSLKREFEYAFSGKTMQKVASIEFDLLKQKEVIKESQDFIKKMKAVEIEDGTARLVKTTYILVAPIAKEKAV